MSRWIAIVLLALAIQVEGADVTASWPAIDAGTNQVTYILRWGERSSEYTAGIYTTNTTALVTNLTVGTWYFATFALVNAVESNPSPETVYRVKPAAPLAPSIRLNLQSSMSITGPWDDLASIDAPIDLGDGMLFYRGRLQVFP